MKYKIRLYKKAKEDINQAIEYYNTKQKDLGIKFYYSLTQKINSLKINPHYQKRYKNTRCLPLKNYPFIIHFLVNEKTNIVEILAVLHTSKQITSLFI